MADSRKVKPTFEGLTFDELADTLGRTVQQWSVSLPRFIDVADNIRLYENRTWTWYAASNEG